MHLRRNETYVMAIEESTDHASGFTVVAVVAVPARWVRPAHAFWHRHLRQFGVPRDAELHATELAAGKGAIRDIVHRYPRPAGVSRADHQRRLGRVLIRRSLRRIASINEVRVALFGTPTPRIPIAYAETFAAMGAEVVARSSYLGTPRIAHVLIDGQDRKLQRLHYESAFLLYRSPRMPKRLRDRREWIIGGATLAESHLVELVQMADIVAFSGLKAHLGHPVLGGFAQKDLIEYASGCWRRNIDMTDSCISAANAVFGACDLTHAVP
jgi:hypothetical protein